MDVNRLSSYKVFPRRSVSWYSWISLLSEIGFEVTKNHWYWNVRQNFLRLLVPNQKKEPSQIYRKFWKTSKLQSFPIILGWLCKENTREHPHLDPVSLPFNYFVSTKIHNCMYAGFRLMLHTESSMITNWNFQFSIISIQEENQRDRMLRTAEKQLSRNTNDAFQPVMQWESRITKLVFQVKGKCFIFLRQSDVKSIPLACSHPLARQFAQLWSELEMESKREECFSSHTQAMTSVCYHLEVNEWTNEKQPHIVFYWDQFLYFFFFSRVNSYLMGEIVFLHFGWNMNCGSSWV